MSKSKYNRTLALFHSQKGLCWICNLPMSVPIVRDPSNVFLNYPYEATLDHLAPKNIPIDPKTYGPNQPRPAKAAHKTCNNRRGHLPLDSKRVQTTINQMKTIFDQGRLFIVGNPYAEDNHPFPGKNWKKNRMRKERLRKRREIKLTLNNSLV